MIWGLHPWTVWSHEVSITQFNCSSKVFTINVFFAEKKPKGSISNTLNLSTMNPSKTIRLIKVVLYRTLATMFSLDNTTSPMAIHIAFLWRRTPRLSRPAADLTLANSSSLWLNDRFLEHQHCWTASIGQLCEWGELGELKVFRRVFTTSGTHFVVSLCWVWS